MLQKRNQYSQRRGELAHPRMTKADFMSYLQAVHKNDVAFLEPIGDLDDDWTGVSLHAFRSRIPSSPLIQWGTNLNGVVSMNNLDYLSSALAIFRL